ncbi:uncharacterized protein LOC125648366 isoform X3 [Ostrea edulis]|nr:uncharacterized protein LOC125648366 isoform X3 [Ostrea edulis]
MMTCIVAAFSDQTFGHTGKQFMVAFFRNLDLMKFNAYILMAAVEDANTTASVYYDHQISLRPSFLQLSPGTVKQLSLQEQYGKQYEKMNTPFPVIRIKASNPVTITAFVDGPMSTASYLVFPIDIAGREYRMMPYCSKTVDGLCICVIITLKTNTAIALENYNNGNLSVYTQAHAVGGETIDYLSLPHSRINFVTREIYSYITLESYDDFSGLLLQTNSSVVVFCGGTKQDATTSMEQLLPVEYFGQNFYSFPFDHNIMSASHLRFISHYNCTTISLDSKHSWIQEAGEFLDIPNNMSVELKIFSNKPIALVQIFSGITPLRKYPNNYEEDIMLLPAVEQYISSVVVPRRKKKDDDPISMPMFVGLVSVVGYTFRTRSGNMQWTTVSKGIVREADDDGKLIKVAKNCGCNDCRNENTFGAYVYRRAGNDSSFSIAGFKFVSRKNDTRRDFGGSCVIKRGTSDFSMITKMRTTTEDNLRSRETRPVVAEQTTTDTDPKAITGTDESVEFATDTMVKETTIRSVTPQCPCELCKPKSTTVSFVKTEEEIREKIKEIKKALVINKNDLSSYRRRKISADDDRSSARGIGLFGACMLCMFVSFIIIMDFKTLVHQGSVLWRKTSRSVSKRLRRKP